MYENAGTPYATHRLMALVNDRFNAIVFRVLCCMVIEWAQPSAVSLAIPTKIKMIFDIFSAFQTVPHKL
jgi:hypothetical protein